MLCNYIFKNLPYMAKLSRGKTFAVVHKHTIHRKTFAVHQAQAIMYCTQQMIQGENLRDWLKTAKVFPLESFAVYGMLHTVYMYVRLFRLRMYKSYFKFIAMYINNKVAILSLHTFCGKISNNLCVNFSL